MKTPTAANVVWIRFISDLAWSSHSFADSVDMFTE
jgi:hypothetical protein